METLGLNKCAVVPESVYLYSLGEMLITGLSCVGGFPHVVGKHRGAQIRAVKRGNLCGVESKVGGARSPTD